MLNWNRSDLLEKTLNSYQMNTKVPHELIIVDNNSTDSSRDIILEYSHKYDDIKYIFPDKNGGGESINLAIPLVKGGYIHISENDLEYLPKWDITALELFSAFPKLGQLSLFSPVPTDEEVWEVHTSKPLFNGGKIIYEAEQNVGTSSIIRGELFAAGLRVKNIKTADFVFPDDGKLSCDVKKLGFIVAWAPRYLVRNLGHSYKEMRQRIDYYRRNYDSKNWLKEEGLKKRLEIWEKTVKPERKSFLFVKNEIQPELSSMIDKQFEFGIVNSQSWSMIDGLSPEIEILELTYSFIRAIKPIKCLDFGPNLGFSSNAILQAVIRNRIGKLYYVGTIENWDAINISFAMAQDRYFTSIGNNDLNKTLFEDIDIILFDAFGSYKSSYLKLLVDRLDIDLDRKWLVFYGDYNNNIQLLDISKKLDKLDRYYTYINTARGMIISSPIGNKEFKKFKNTNSKSLLYKYITKIKAFIK